uniref:Endonuclease/exonuclease/phosphatase domain-containing protein n=1 Tax=Polytomella parva TaxID=51329 RepID=A0A7S0UU93_9CHLO|mmetsp:Transcript_18183/g.33209  ORF Transcript_18183/g.33209 Transcript_18183/m.33209 type:complete len:411 (+) Transcript_18183:192-1424(+)
MALVSIANVKLTTGDGVCCGISIEPYIGLKKGDTSVSVLEIEEGAPNAGQYQLRSRWYRSATPAGGSVCLVHPEREANLQCTLCLKFKVPAHFSFHCTPECLRSSWNLHLKLHDKAHNAATYENGVLEPSPNFYPKLNSLSEKGDKWIEVGKSRIYTPTPEDVGHVLKFEAYIIETTGGKNGSDAYMVGKLHSILTSRVRPTPTVPIRHLISLPQRQAFHKSNSFKFTILTYNVLADVYAQSDLFSCPSWMLQWNYRKHNLLTELMTYKPDVICLQEVQDNHYEQFWCPELQKAGYVGVFKNKAVGLFRENKRISDGCATFFRTSKFSLRKKYEVEFNQATKNLEEAKTDPQDRRSVRIRFTKDNVALLTVLEFNESVQSGRKLVCVANTHIHANPDLTDVKIWQGPTLL